MCRPSWAAQAPPEEARPLFLQFAALEENHGLARTAMEVYDRAVRTLPEPERLAVYELYLAKASEFFGIGKARTSGHICKRTYAKHEFLQQRPVLVPLRGYLLTALLLMLDLLYAKQGCFLSLFLMVCLLSLCRCGRSMRRRSRPRSRTTCPTRTA